MKKLNTCFVISPIGAPRSDIRRRSDQVLKHLIRPAAGKCGYTVLRADEISKAGDITSEVIQHLLDDPLVVADLTGGNPNVYYELAVRHASGKPFVQIIEAGEPLPFDVAGIRTIQVDHKNLDSVEEAKEAIVAQIATFKKRSRGLIRTPITGAIDLQLLKKSDKPEQRSLASLMTVVSELRSSLTKIDARSKQVLSVIRSERESTDSIFSERAQHYKREKEFMAEQFLNHVLGPRVKYLKESFPKRKIRIVFDSGTTIAPMLNVLGAEAENDERHWCRDVPVVTNNIKGVENMLRYRDRQSGRYSRLPISRFSVLPGEVLAAFEAIADTHTLDALESYRNDKTFTIAITTGNYILLHNHQFLPIARAGYHPDFKATLYDIADEVYVVAPLGKILMWTGNGLEAGMKVNSLKDVLASLNCDLGFKALPRDQESEDKQYQLVTDRLAWSKQHNTRHREPDILSWLRKSVLITTRRNNQCLFFSHFKEVESQLHRNAFKVGWEPKSGPRLWTSPFTALPVSLHEQFEIEMPHKNLWKGAEKYFFLPDEWTDTEKRPSDNRIRE